METQSEFREKARMVLKDKLELRPSISWYCRKLESDTENSRHLFVFWGEFIPIAEFVSQLTPSLEYDEKHISAVVEYSEKCDYGSVISLILMEKCGIRQIICKNLTDSIEKVIDSLTGKTFEKL